MTRPEKRWRRRSNSRPEPGVARSTRGVSIVAAVVQFAIVGVAAATIVAIVAGARVRSTGTNEAIRDAREWATLLSGNIIAPQVNDAVLAGDAAALGKLDEVVSSVVKNGPIFRIKVWTADGRVVYSDDKSLIGKTFELAAPVKQSIATGAPFVDVTMADDAENQFEGAPSRQLEVYMPFRLSDGRLMLYEHYQYYTVLSDGAAKVTAAFSPLVLKSLIVLEVVQLPLAWWLARRVRAAQRQKEMLLRSALDASDNERRRIARDLHDGVVQDLAGRSAEDFLSEVAKVVQIEPSATAVAGQQKYSFGMLLGDQWYQCRYLDIPTADADPLRALDVSLLQDRILGPLLGIEDPRTDQRISFVGGIRGTAELERLVGAGAAVAFSMPATAVLDLIAVADKGDVMPPKSTWFEPKLPSGLFIHPF